MLSRWIFAAAVVPAVIVGFQVGNPGLPFSAPSAPYREAAAHGSLRAISPMLEPRSGHAAVLLGDGKVLIVGGMRRNQDFYRSAELYDPATQRFSATGSLATARVGMAAVRLPSGKVLVVGGWTGHDTTDDAELYDPATGIFADAGTHDDKARAARGNAPIYRRCARHGWRGPRQPRWSCVRRTLPSCLRKI